MNYRRLTRRAARRYGLDPYIFQRQIGRESVNFDRNVILGRRRSPAGAQGIAQFMPATARGLGVDPLNPKQALNAAAKLMAGYVRKYGSYENALRAYNAGPGAIKQSHGYAETNNYVSAILGGRDPKTLGSRSGGGAGGVSGTPGSPATVGAQNIAMGSTGALAAIAALTQQKPAPPQSTLPAPSFAAAPTLPKGYTGVQTGGGPEPQGPDLNALLEQIRTPGGDVQLAPGSPGMAGVTGGIGSSATGKGRGRVVLSPGADRPGVQTGSAVLDFARQVSGIAGETLRIGTGTRHSRMTVDGNVSDHWSGNAADIPARGAKLIRLGQDALIAAGMDPRKARRETGGLYNVHGHQIIFNTHQGGDHTNHLHISARARRR